MKSKEKMRCLWVKPDDPLYIAYHDTEWGVPVRDDKKIFEFLVLESAQAGLSWLTILRKRKNYAAAFAQFEAKRVATYTQKNIEKLLQNEGIVRNRQKIEAAINNAKRFLEVQKEWGSFSNYMWQFVKNKPIIHHDITSLTDYPKTIPEAHSLADDMKRRGFSFFGPTICYAHMQALGMVNDHMTCCFLYKKQRNITSLSQKS